jgi:hypothetical protein
MTAIINKSTIEVNVAEIIVRPSSLDTFLGCSYQWARVFLGGQVTIPNSRAVLGTGIHGGAESIWSDARLGKSKDAINLAAAKDAALECFNQEVEQFGIAYGDDEDESTITSELINGVDAFYEDIVPYAEIPTHIEHRFTLGISGHPLIKAVSGTVDYLASHVKTQADIKTSKRKSNPSSHIIQQSTYKILAEHEGHSVEHIQIHNVVMTKNPVGEILLLEPNVEQAKYVINTLLDVTELVMTEQIRPEVLFRGNPKYMFCSNKYCTLHSTCPFVRGNAPDVTKNDVKTIAKEAAKLNNNRKKPKL